MSTKSTQLLSGILGCISGGFTGALFLPGMTWFSFFLNHRSNQTSGPSASDIMGYAIYFIWVIGPIVGVILGVVTGSILGWFCGQRFGTWSAILAGVVVGLLSYPLGLFLFWLWASS